VILHYGRNRRQRAGRQQLYMLTALVNDFVLNWAWENLGKMGT
jgi:hypothetical protein